MIYSTCILTIIKTIFNYFLIVIYLHEENMEEKWNENNQNRHDKCNKAE